MNNLQPVSLKDAIAFTKRYHRHHPYSHGGKWAVGVNDGTELVGVAIIGRPVARLNDDGWTAEVTRCCARDGFKNVASMLYGAAWRAARAMGYRRLITYTLKSESGGSLVASGYRCIGECGGGTWNRKNRPRTDKHPTEGKMLWERTLTPAATEGE